MEKAEMELFRELQVQSTVLVFTAELKAEMSDGTLREAQGMLKIEMCHN